MLKESTFAAGDGRAKEASKDAVVKAGGSAEVIPTSVLIRKTHVQRLRVSALCGVPG
jgi:hypothetical protein